MDIEKLREQLKIDEGCVYEIYNDHLGYPTFGIGHLVIESDPENLGRPRLSAFKGMKAGVDSRDWNEAADQMVDSRWYRQVGARAERLVERMRNV